MRVAGSHVGSIAYVLILTAVSLVPVTVYWTTSSPAIPAAHSMSPFASVDEVHQFILTKSCNSVEVQGLYNPTAQPRSTTGQWDTVASLSGSSTTSPLPNHSETNAQVVGVDELDTVKNDGAYVYTVTNNTVAIVLAYPVSDAKLVARVSVNGSLQGIFVEANRLVVVSQRYQYYPYPMTWSGVAQPATSTMAIYPVYSSSGTSSVSIFDITDHSNPQLKTTLVMNGTIAGARLIGDYAYFVATQPVYCTGPVPLPTNIINGRSEIMAPALIYHSDIADYANSFTTVVGIDITQTDPSPTAKTFLIGTSSTIYVSAHQIYLTQPIWTQAEETAVHRISIDGANISYDATGTVSGHVLNQFSMDEYKGFFRVATSNFGFASALRIGVATTLTQPQTNVYVLDSGLHIVGRLEGLSPGETFYAARFMGDRAYLVTFQRIDPLFVVGLEDPYNPILFGQLEITGVSDYLQPYDENHLIGLGKSSMNLTWENAALFQGLKLSLFDVTDPSHPLDTSDYLVGDRGSDSPALTDHKAVLFDRPLNLLVVPVEVAKAQQSSTSPWTYNPMVWQGAYVFDVTVQNGIVFRGGVTHLPSGQTPGYANGSLFVTRALYIGNVLYTISNGLVMMNSLTDLSELGSVSLA